MAKSTHAHIFYIIFVLFYIFRCFSIIFFSSGANFFFKFQLHIDIDYMILHLQYKRGEYYSIRWLAFWHTFTYNYISKIENCLFFGDFFFRENIILYFFLNCNQTRRTLIQVLWLILGCKSLQDFFFILCGGRTTFCFVFSLFTAAVCLQFFYSFKISLYVTDCVLCPSYGIHTWFNISRALTFVFTEFFFIYFGTIFLFCF